jgi:hypothetical protein
MSVVSTGRPYRGALSPGRMWMLIHTIPYAREAGQEMMSGQRQESRRPLNPTLAPRSIQLFNRQGAIRRG